MSGLAGEIARNRNWYLFLLPAVLFYVLFAYSPMYFLQIAFRDFRITRAVSGSPWVGLKYFRQLFDTVGFWNAFANTLIISAYKLVFAWPVPIMLALLLNEIGNQRFKRVVQTIIYLPHFISWVIIGGILYNFTAINGGLFNKILLSLGRDPVLFLGTPRLFRPILVLSDIWKEAGWGTIIYLASITRISAELYEAAVVDGAGRLRQMRDITLPGIKDVIVVLLILRLGNILNVGFEQVLVLQNQMVLEVGDILDTFVWRLGLQQGRYSFATAAGLFRSVIAAVMIYAADRMSKRFGEAGLF